MGAFIRRREKDVELFKEWNRRVKITAKSRIIASTWLRQKNMNYNNSFKFTSIVIGNLKRKKRKTYLMGKFFGYKVIFYSYTHAFLI
ncbi:hypothetical protein ABIE66_001876 [Peribacillus sp. B2I2]|uniref:hypothetical protein n=1 Tax=Peribacillus sp. B2I2 TaxID=3156468 RepID=UPI003517B859